MKIPQKIQAALDEGRKVFSFEYFPPKTADGVENLFDRMDRMVAYQPAFCDITWGAGGSTADLTLEIATRMQNNICVETSMHLTCTNMPVERIDHALEHIKAAGLQNVLALRGDPPHGQDKFVAAEGGFSCALDLVKHIRAKYGDYFGITVAGYPEAHPDAISGPDGATPEEYQKDLEYLKAKMDAGADLIVTQLFYDVDIFLKFVADCRAMGVSEPIIPGIMPITTYGGFKRMTAFCKTKVPQSILDALEPIKDNEEAVRAYGIQQGTEMCRRILDAGIHTLHMYTLNQDKTTIAILKNLGLIEASNIPRTLPWRPATNIVRCTEDVRPIYWSLRPKSYLARTAAWTKFPSGRLGPAEALSYSDLPAKHRAFLKRKSRATALARDWAVPVASTEDVKQLFARFVSGEVSSFPWSEAVEASLSADSAPISAQLQELNAAGLLTINSQPAVNGAKSDDPVLGWGGPGGYIYQKAYVECCAPHDKVTTLLEKAKATPSISLMAVNSPCFLPGWGGPGGYIYQKAYVECFAPHDKVTTLLEKAKATPSISLMAVNSQGHVLATGPRWGGPGGYIYQKAYVECFAPHDKVTTLLEKAKATPSISLMAVNSQGHVLATGPGTPASTTPFSANAVTWGVFPGREVVQPTVADFMSFLAWKEEAFGAWVEDWAGLYKEEDEEGTPVAKKLLQEERGQGREVVQPTVADFLSFLAWKEEAFGAWVDDWAGLYKEEDEGMPVAKMLLQEVRERRVHGVREEGKGTRGREVVEPTVADFMSFLAGKAFGAWVDDSAGLYKEEDEEGTPVARKLLQEPPPMNLRFVPISALTGSSPQGDRGGESGSARFEGLGKSAISCSRGASNSDISGSICEGISGGIYGGHATGTRRINTRAPAPPPVFTGEQWTTAHAFTAAEVAAFAHMTGDLNPIHLDARAAEAAGFAECVVHGILAASLFPALIAKHHPGAIYVSQTLRFLAPVHVGEQVTATVEAISVVAHRHRFRVTFASKAFKTPRVTPAAAADAATSGDVAPPRPVLALDGIAVAIIPPLSNDPPKPMECRDDLLRTGLQSL
ncbi:unnamed protein product [Closterium sp. Naga37s-1]|nr:unnamed protein product [Closterium sp. Naga37s-1]